MNLTIFLSIIVKPGLGIVLGIGLVVAVFWGMLVFLLGYIILYFMVSLLGG